MSNTRKNHNSAPLVSISVVDGSAVANGEKQAATSPVTRVENPEFDSIAAQNIKRFLLAESKSNKDFTLITPVRNEAIQSLSYLRLYRVFMFKLDDQYYEIYDNARKIYKENCPHFSPTPVNDKGYIFVVVKQGNEEYLILKEGTEFKGHAKLAENFELVLAAGEIYFNQNKLILINNKSGSYYEQLSAESIKAIMEKYFPQQKNIFFPFNNKKELEIELKKRRQTSFAESKHSADIKNITPVNSLRSKFFASLAPISMSLAVDTSKKRYNRRSSI